MPVQTRSMAAAAQKKKKKITIKKIKITPQMVTDLFEAYEAKWGEEGVWRDFESLYEDDIIPNEYLLTIDEARKIADGKMKPMIVRGGQDYAGAYYLTKDYEGFEDRDEDDARTCGWYYSHGDNIARTGSGGDTVMKITPQSFKWLKDYIAKM